MNQFELFINEHSISFFFILMVLIIWTTIWKGMSLWKAANTKDKWWFIALLIVNTVGILEILYIFVFSKEKESKDSAQENNKRL